MNATTILVPLDGSKFAESAAYLSGVEHLVRNGSQNVATVVVDGVSPAVGILETAERNAADMIAITTHGRSGLPRIILGSVADKVVRASHVPVLVVRPNKRERPA